MKPFVITLIASVTFALGAAPAAAEPFTEVPAAATASSLSTISAQSLTTQPSAHPTEQIQSVLTFSESSHASHGFDVDATIALAKSEVGTSRATGWNQQGECIMSVQRWIHAGGGAWTGGGDPISNYNGALRLSVGDAQPGDVVQYEHLSFPTSWVSGIHTVLITGTNGDGTFSIVESNNPGGSGLVTSTESWVPKPPPGFQAVIWRF